jgi:acetyltransferase-like isoleucine patch superfamily enzyme
LTSFLSRIFGGWGTSKRAEPASDSAKSLASPRIGPEVRVGKGSIVDSTVDIQAKNGSIVLGDRVQVRRFSTIDATAGRINIGDRTVIFPFAMVMTYPAGEISIGSDCTINPFCVLYGRGGLRIGNFVRIATHTVIVPANHNFDDPSRPIAQQGFEAKGIDISDDVWIGANVTILDGVSLGEGCVVAAGSVVTRSFGPRSVIGGVPAKVLRKRGEISTKS